MAKFWFKESTSRILMDNTGPQNCPNCACDEQLPCCNQPVILRVTGVRYKSTSTCNCDNFNTEYDLRPFTCTTRSGDPFDICSVGNVWAFWPVTDPFEFSQWGAGVLLDSGTLVGSPFDCCNGVLLNATVGDTNCDWTNAKGELRCCTIPGSMCFKFTAFTGGFTASRATLIFDMVNGWWKGCGTYTNGSCTGSYCVWIYSIPNDFPADVGIVPLPNQVAICFDPDPANCTDPNQFPVTNTLTYNSRLCCATVGPQFVLTNQVVGGGSGNGLCDGSFQTFSAIIVPDCDNPAPYGSCSSILGPMTTQVRCRCDINSTDHPNTLYATFTNKTGCATCLPDSTPISRYYPADTFADGLDPLCQWWFPPMCGQTGHTLFIGSVCGDFQLYYSASVDPPLFGQGVNPTTCACSPLSVVFQNIAIACVSGGTGTVTVTITE